MVWGQTGAKTLSDHLQQLQSPAWGDDALIITGKAAIPGNQPGCMPRGAGREQQIMEKLILSIAEPGCVQTALRLTA